MLHTRQAFAATLFAFAMNLIAAPAMADSYIHATATEQGYKVYPDHFRSEVTRAEVIAQAREAVTQGGSSRFADQRFPATYQASGSSLTRQEVIQQLLDETPSQRASRLRSLSE
jgi:hypothetical protein